jgi:hypothetical protein
LERYFDDRKLLEDVNSAITKALAEHGLEPYHPLAVATVLEAVASPLKFQLQATPLSHKVGKLGVEIYFASRVLRAVELLKSPHSQIVNPMMDAATLALLRRRQPLPKSEMLRDALRVHLNKPRLSERGIPKAAGNSLNMYQAALGSALTYLVEGEIVSESEDGQKWCMAGGWQWLFF